MLRVTTPAGGARFRSVGAFYRSAARLVEPLAALWLCLTTRSILAAMRSEPPQPHVASVVKLAPVLGLFSAGALVVGEVIGSGIFLKPSQVAQGTGGYLGLILGLWIGCGLVNLCGALTLSELSAMMPHAGGTYVFLREAYGRLWGFLWAWAEFWVIRSGAIAALAAAMAIFLASFLEQIGVVVPVDSRRTVEAAVAVAAILVLSIVNIIGTRWGGAVQNVTTVIKAGFLVVLAVLPFVALREGTVDNRPLWPATVEVSLFAGLGSALAGIMWAYDGWGQITVVAEEIKRPSRNVPLAMAGGVVILIVLYAGATLAFHLTLPSSAIAASPAPAIDAMQRLMPGVGTKIMTAMLMISVFGALNSNILVGPRVVFAVARDHDGLHVLRRVDPRFGTPALAIALVSLWSIVLVVAGDLPRWLGWASVSAEAEPKRLFDILTDYTIFGGSIFYLAAVLAVFVLRRTHPELRRPYRTWGYPLVPGVFVVSYILLLVSMAWAAPVECSSGLVLIVVGTVVYLGLFRRPANG